MIGIIRSVRLSVVVNGRRQQNAWPIFEFDTVKNQEKQPILFGWTGL